MIKPHLQKVIWYLQVLECVMCYGIVRSSGLKLEEFFERSELELSTLISVNSIVQQYFSGYK